MKTWIKVIVALFLIAATIGLIQSLMDFREATEGKPEIRQGFGLTWFFMLLCSWALFGTNNNKK